MSRPTTATCEHCGLTVAIVTVRMGGTVSPGRFVRVFASHAHPDFPDGVCLGSLTWAPRKHT